VTGPVRMSLVLLLAAGAFLAAIAEAERRGAARERARVLSARVDTLRVTERMTDTLWRDTLRIATRARLVWDTVRATDTIRVRDTLYVPLAAAEAAVESCWAANRACARAGAAKDTLLAAQDARWAARPAPPSAARLWSERAIYFLAGYGIRSLVVR